MRCLHLAVFYCSLTSLVFADAPKLWSDGKITSAQPFEAAVIAAGGVSPWSGTTQILLIELGDKKRVCLATLKIATATNFNELVDYKIIDSKEYEAVILALSKEPSVYHACVFSPPLPVDRFAWVSPLGIVGHPFGDKDMLQIVALRLLEGVKINNTVEQAGTGQPATRPELKSEGSDKPQPESEGRSR